jgi:hypothetical protein
LHLVLVLVLVPVLVQQYDEQKKDVDVNYLRFFYKY